MLFVSLAPDALGAGQRRDLKAALALAANPHPLAEPLDWQRTVTPARWRLLGGERAYDWIGKDGVGPPWGRSVAEPRRSDVRRLRPDQPPVAELLQAMRRTGGDPAAGAGLGARRHTERGGE